MSNSPQDRAIAYCLSLGLDPYEKVLGKQYHDASPSIRPRYFWYLGAQIDEK